MSAVMTVKGMVPTMLIRPPMRAARPLPSLSTILAPIGIATVAPAPCGISSRPVWTASSWRTIWKYSGIRMMAPNTAAPRQKLVSDAAEYSGLVNRNRESLLEVARVVIVEESVDASLRDVARRAGVGIATLYRHFPTREALLEVVVRNGFDALRMLADELIDDPSPRDALVTWMRRFSAGSGTCRGLSGSVLAGLRDGTSELHASSQGMHMAATRLLDRAQKAGEVRADVTATDVITMAAAVSWVAQIADPDQATRVLSVLTDGPAPPTRDRTVVRRGAVVVA